MSASDYNSDKDLNVSLDGVQIDDGLAPFAVTHAIRVVMADMSAFAANPLTAAELQQLQNINSVTISNAQWAYVGAMDQGVATGDDVAFKKLDISTTNRAAVSVVDSSVSAAAPWIYVLGKRSDANSHFDGKLALAKNYTGGAIVSGSKIGTVLFGGNHTDGTEGNIAYAAGIYGISDGVFNSVSDMPTALVFGTGVAGIAPNASSFPGTERMRIGSDGLVTVANALTVSGAFTSLGINDNSAFEVLTLASTTMTVGVSTFALNIQNRTATQHIGLSGGTTGNLGANIRLHGESHATLAKDMLFRSGTTNWLQYDDSAALVTITPDTTITGDLTIGANSFKPGNTLSKATGYSTSTVANTTAWVTWKTPVIAGANSGVTITNTSEVIDIDDTGTYKFTVTVNTTSNNRTELIIHTWIDFGAGYVEQTDDIIHNYVARDIDQDNGGVSLATAFELTAGDKIKFQAEGDCDGTCVLKTAGTIVLVERVG